MYNFIIIYDLALYIYLVYNMTFNIGNGYVGCHYWRIVETNLGRRA
jgi:hypothetical protein